MKNKERNLKFNIKQNLKTKTPFVYKKLSNIRKNLKLLIESFSELSFYISTKFQKKPYFSIYTKGLKSERTKCMAKFIKEEVLRNKGKHFKVLEVGSYLGSSAILWAEAIKKYNNGNGTVICIDSWIPFFGDNNDIGFSSNSALQMEKALSNDKVFPGFLHNIKVTGLDGIICPFKGKSSELLPYFKYESFDYIYLDAGHRYSEVLNDLKLSAPLLSEYGVIGGDDMELQKDQIDFNYAEENKEKDNILDPKTKILFHPGVSIAVSEFIKNKISCKEGFWVMRKVKNDWENIEL